MGNIAWQKTIPDSQQHKTTILVVEDEVLVRMMMANGLRDEGYIVIEAASADEALAILHSGVMLNLVVTDMRMPGVLDGAALAREVRTVFPFLKTVMVSGQKPDAAVHKHLDPFFIKPCDPAILTRYLSTLLANGGE